MKPTTAAALGKINICDEVLWTDFKNGNKDAFATLYYRYFKILIQRCITICQDTDLIKDCVHDLFVDIWKNRLNLVIPYSVKAYLLRSLQRKIIRQLKKNKTGRNEFFLEKIAAAEVVYPVEKKIIAEQFQEEQRNDILKAIKLLTKRQQEAVYLKFYANMSYSEIAGKMSISTDSIYNLISKAMNNMQHELQKARCTDFNQ